MAQGLIERVGAVASTQDLAHQRAAAGAPHGTAIIATEQRAGRGTRGRAWHAPAGGLWLSVIARIPASALDCLSVRVGLAIAEALDPLVAERILLKWPNDIMVRDRKAGGILVEARWSGDQLNWVVIGVGLNVVNPIPAELADRALGLGAVGPATVGAVEALVLATLPAAVERAGPELTPDEWQRLGSRDWLAGRSLAGPEGGRCEGIDRQGRLVIRKPDGSRTTRLSPVDWADLAGPEGPA